MQDQDGICFSLLHSAHCQRHSLSRYDCNRVYLFRPIKRYSTCMVPELTQLDARGNLHFDATT
jgi:hypothetical protein